MPDSLWPRWFAPLLLSVPRFDPRRDFTHVTMVGTTPYVLLSSAAFPAKTMREAIDYLRANSGRLNYASAGAGTLGHLITEAFLTELRVSMTHVPYKGGASALPDLMAGQLQVLFNPPITAIPQVKAGKLRALAVSSARRLTAMPEVPTVAELGYPGYDAATWFSVLARRGSPQPILDRLTAELKKIVDTPALREQFAAQAIEFQWGDPADVAALVKKDLARWGDVIRKGGIKVEPL